MPLDYLAQRSDSEKALTDLIGGRNIEDEIAKTNANVTKSRGQFFDQLDPTISQFTPGNVGVDRKRIPELDRQTQATLDKQKRDLTMKKYLSIFNNAMDLASRRGLDSASAQAYARKIADQNTQMDTLAAAGVQQRLKKLRGDALSNEYAQKGIDLEGKYQPQIDYGAALTRVLLGTGVNVATWKALNSNKTPTQNPMYPQTQNYSNPTNPNSPIYTGFSEDTNV